MLYSRHKLLECVTHVLQAAIPPMLSLNYLLNTLLSFVSLQEKLDELEEQIADNFHIWSVPKDIKKTNVYACVVEGDDDEDDDEDEMSSEPTKFYRARVVEEDKRVPTG